MTTKIDDQVQDPTQQVLQYIKSAGENASYAERWLSSSLAVFISSASDSTQKSQEVETPEFYTNTLASMTLQIASIHQIFVDLIKTPEAVSKERIMEVVGQAIASFDSIGPVAGKRMGELLTSDPSSKEGDHLRMFLAALSESFDILKALLSVLVTQQQSSPDVDQNEKKEPGVEDEQKEEEWLNSLTPIPYVAEKRDRHSSNDHALKHTCCD